MNMITFKQFLLEKADIKVLLAKAWMGQDVTGWWMSEKLDGVRAWWDGKHFWTRNGNDIFAPKWFIDGFPKITMDGELFAGRGKFNQTLSTVRKLIPVDKQWKGLTFQVFDLPESGGGFEARIDKMKAIAKHRYIKTLRQTKVKDNQWLNKQLQKVTGKGGEGLMVRMPGSKYEKKRSGTLLKIKIFHDSEAKVIDHQEGTGKYVGMMGALIVKNDKGVTFRVGTGFTDKERANPPPIGSEITYKFQELTPKGIPRFPSYWRMSDKI